MKKRTFKIEGTLEIDELDWSIERINKEFKRMIEDNTDIKFNGKLEEIDE